MANDRFEEFKEDFQHLYLERDYNSAYQLASQYIQDFPERWPLITYWRISSAARAGMQDQALGILNDCLDSGFWYGDILLRENPALAPLQNLTAFKNLLNRNEDVKSQDQSNQFPLLMVRPEGECQGESNVCPLLVGLHTNASTARESLDFWSPAATAGWLVAAPQSSQAIWKDAYVWDDLEYARREIDAHLSRLNQQYAIETDRIVLAGHDVGAETALWIALKSPGMFSGFVLLGINGPLSENPGSWDNLVEEYQEQVRLGAPQMRGYFIVGEEDRVSPIENMPLLSEMLIDAGVVCKLERVAGLSHSYGGKYDPALLRALDYVSGPLER
jgi:predicted esterase